MYDRFKRVQIPVPKPKSKLHCLYEPRPLELQVHLFSVRVAERYGLTAALVAFLLTQQCLTLRRKAKDNGNWYKEGRYHWQRWPVSFVQRTLPYLTSHQIRTALTRLCTGPTPLFVRRKTPPEGCARNGHLGAAGDRAHFYRLHKPRCAGQLRKVHKLNAADAVAHGPRSAAILYRLRHWLEVNAANATHMDDEHYAWHYDSPASIRALQPYLATSSIQRSLRDLQVNGVLTKGCFDNNRRRNIPAWRLSSSQPVDFSKFEKTLDQLDDEAIPQDVDATDSSSTFYADFENEVKSANGEVKSATRTLSSTLTPTGCNVPSKPLDEEYRKKKSLIDQRQRAPKSASLRSASSAGSLPAAGALATARCTPESESRMGPPGWSAFQRRLLPPPARKPVVFEDLDLEEEEGLIHPPPQTNPVIAPPAAKQPDTEQELEEERKQKQKQEAVEELPLMSPYIREQMQAALQVNGRKPIPRPGAGAAKTTHPRNRNRKPGDYLTSD